jgi:hypothetical protein
MTFTTPLLLRRSCPEHQDEVVMLVSIVTALHRHQGRTPLGFSFAAFLAKGKSFGLSSTGPSPVDR